MTSFIIIGVVVALIGVIVLAAGIRHHREQQPKYTAMLIGGMMATAFGVVIAGFAIAYQRAAPLDLNTGAAG